MKIMVTVLRAGHYRIEEIDGTIIDGIPFAVFEWSALPDGSRRPSASVRLDPRYLSVASGSWLTHIYSFPIEDPRPFH